MTAINEYIIVRCSSVPYNYDLSSAGYSDGKLNTVPIKRKEKNGTPKQKKAQTPGIEPPTSYSQ